VCSQLFTEVIEIFQGLCAHIFEHVDEAGFTSIERTAAPVGIGNPPSDIFGADLIEVAVGPAHRRLDCKMETVEPDRERHFEAAHHERFDVVECDLEAGDGGSAHAASLRRSCSGAQYLSAALRVPSP
jgi:hypothetical protein